MHQNEYKHDYVLVELFFELQMVFWQTRYCDILNMKLEQQLSTETQPNCQKLILFLSHSIRGLLGPARGLDVGSAQTPASDHIHVYTVDYQW